MLLVLVGFVVGARTILPGREEGFGKVEGAVGFEVRARGLDGVEVGVRVAFDGLFGVVLFLGDLWFG